MLCGGSAGAAQRGQSPWPLLAEAVPAAPLPAPSHLHPVCTRSQNLRGILGRTKDGVQGGSREEKPRDGSREVLCQRHRLKGWPGSGPRGQQEGGTSWPEMVAKEGGD